jgi:Sec-independent protein secretion pathway component TatC
MLALPLWLLYELGIVVARMLVKPLPPEESAEAEPGRNPE